MSNKYYAYILENENTTEIVTTWELCKNRIAGKKARYKSFKTEKEAKEWLNNGGIYEDKVAKKKLMKLNLQEGIYFDAGTGRGIGVEVRVTDITGKSLLPEFMPPHLVNPHENYSAPTGSTNNYGELIGLYLAIDISLKKNIYKIFGDSNLVIQYWSKGLFNKNNLNEKTISLIEKVSEKRKIFEKLGGSIEHVSGDINPADLGFHK
ncbi:MAG: ribonuclease H family protein [Cetobacterium sp.]|uniref:ribonuclease H family protein n=1 Tax=unclassified Cetobacterium TaxID=2630983 RepID=UPI00163C40EF|nr:ribonuclease H family protein [Cetobacterium sp. 2A]MBC2855915.1 viroplasmin family protein [Cetobacterium sp. 2A]